VALFGPDHEFTKLVIDLKGKDPDDAFSSIPYEKVCSTGTSCERLIMTNFRAFISFTT
jgi:hypothetical protein